MAEEITPPQVASISGACTEAPLVRGINLRRVKQDASPGARRFFAQINGRATNARDLGAMSSRAYASRDCRIHIISQLFLSARELSLSLRDPQRSCAARRLHYYNIVVTSARHTDERRSRDSCRCIAKSRPAPKDTRGRTNGGESRPLRIIIGGRARQAKSSVHPVDVPVDLPSPLRGTVNMQRRLITFHESSAHSVEASYRFVTRERCHCVTILRR